MGRKLVIVESPTKVKTIKKYLGSTYVVEATMGHVRDLPKSQLGVDVDNNYEPKYITIRGKGPILDKLKKEAKKADKVYLATDPDREGEAISWHLAQSLKIDESKLLRIEFNEITKTAVKSAIKNPRKIDVNLVNAQQARRVLDRLVGYEISPILWKKVKWGLSAGRVQSVTLKIICDRDHEISTFKEEEYWSIEANLKGASNIKVPFKLANLKGKKLNIANKTQCDEILSEIKTEEFKVKSISKHMKEKSPGPPFTTSTLQQDANRKLGYTTKRTMMIAQKLYEGFEIKGHGTVGLITYMRTDSVRVSGEAQETAKEYISKNIGDEYVPKKPNVYKSKKEIQDAHEAIRPSNIEITPELAKSSMKLEEYKLYKLIWSRFISSQMANCKYENTTIDVLNSEYLFKASGNVTIFKGFTKIYENSNESKEQTIPVFNKDEILELIEVEGIQHFTQPPARFSEASLIKSMEENGIGRPSTYAPTIGTLLGRRYVQREKKIIVPTELGFIVNDIMSEYFKNIVDVEFTACMEEKLDKVAEGELEWKAVVDEYFTPVKKLIEIAENEISKVTIEDVVTDIKCDKCGKFMVIKKGRYGDFLACPGYPECKYTKPIVVELDVSCPKCGSKLLARKSKKGNKFYGCSGYPNCDFVSWYEPTNEKCPTCGALLAKRHTKAKGDYLQCINNDCKYKTK